MENKITVQLGRPVNPNSVRQQRIAELEAKRANGECKRGRPVVANSKRQAVLAERAEKVANGGTLKRGRPIVESSARQLKLALKAAKQFQAPNSVIDTLKEMIG